MPTLDNSSSSDEIASRDELEEFQGSILHLYSIETQRVVIKMTFYIRGIQKSFLTIIDSGSDCNFFSSKFLHPRFWTKWLLKFQLNELKET